MVSVHGFKAAKRRGKKWAMLTAYDALTAELLEKKIESMVTERPAQHTHTAPRPQTPVPESRVVARIKQQLIEEIEGRLDSIPGITLNFSQVIQDDTIVENTTQTFSLILNNGNYSWNVSCTDNSFYSNTNISPTRRLEINASGTYGISLRDIGVDEAWYFKTDGQGLNTQDAGMASWNNITLDLLDDNVNTPATTSVLRTRQGEKYEGFVAKALEDSKSYTKIVLYGRVRIVDESPFFLRVYPYNQSGSINPSQYAEFSVNASILDEKVKWIELDITNIAKSEDNFGWLRVRVTAQNASAQENDRFQFSELHYKVG